MRVYAGIGKIQLAAAKLVKLEFGRSTYNLAEYQYTLGVYWAQQEDLSQANEYFQKALEHNPYHHNSRMTLIRNMAKTPQKNEAIGLLQEAMQLDLPWTPEFAARAFVPE